MPRPYGVDDPIQIEPVGLDALRNVSPLWRVAFESGRTLTVPEQELWDRGRMAERYYRKFREPADVFDVFDDTEFDWPLFLSLFEVPQP